MQIANNAFGKLCRPLENTFPFFLLVNDVKCFKGSAWPICFIFVSKGVCEVFGFSGRFMFFED
jgi:hypothetical protein